MNVFKVRRTVLTTKAGSSLECQIDGRSISICLRYTDHDDNERSFDITQSDLEASAEYRGEIESIAKELLRLVNIATPARSRPEGY